MKAAVLHKGERHLRIEEVANPVAGAGEVRVKVECCGVCGSDLHATIHKKVSLSHYPCIMGHEASGTVLESGPGAELFKPGDRVVIAAGTSCGVCAACLQGRENACAEAGVLGFARDGAYAEEIVTFERCLTALPDAVPFAEGAIMADAVSTPYHALKVVGRLSAGETVAVVGCGGLGIHGVLLAKALGAGRVLAVDMDDGALANAAALGADELVSVKNVKNPGKALKKKAGGEVDLILDFSGYYPSVQYYLQALSIWGRMVLVGLGAEMLSIQLPSNIVYKHLSINGSLGCERNAIGELIDLYVAGKLNLKKSITSIHPLEEVNDCLENLAARNGNPIRYVIKPGG